MVAVLILPAAFAAAIVVDACGEQFVYTKSSDFTDSRVVINFESGDHQIDVFAKSGYEITKVELDVDNDGHSGYHTYATSSVNNFNPAGNQIDSARVTVKKTCPDVCPNIEGDQYVVPEGKVLEEGQCVTPEEPEEPTATSTPETPSEPAKPSSTMSGGGGMCHPSTGYPECQQPQNYAFFGITPTGAQKDQLMLFLIQQVLGKMSQIFTLIK